MNATTEAIALKKTPHLPGLPLLGSVGHPVAVNPDARLHQYAVAQGWPVIDLLGRPVGA